MKNFLRKNKLVLWLCIIIIIITSIMACLFVAYQRQTAIKNAGEDLQLLANEKAVQVNMFFEFQKEKLSIIASMNVFKEAVLYPNDSAKIVTAKNRIDELKSIVSRIAIFTNAGLMFIAESGPVPMDYSALPYFVSQNKHIIFMRYYDPFQKKDYYSVLGPIYDSIEKDKVIGAIAFDVELDKISALMKETLESETNEVYLINETGLLLSGSEYIGQGNKKGVLIQEVKSEEAQECLADLKKYGGEGEVAEHEEGESSQYLDYMGNEVYGAHAYVPAIGGCVIAEISAAEVMSFSILDYIKNTFSNK
jgi:hypothetical protein